ncbi:hypothetical protein D0661_13045 [Salmonella enterica]|nr:hypothetical protein [Salmonella enterica]
MTDTKKPAVLVLCGLSVLHRTYPNHDLVGWRPCGFWYNLLICMVIFVLVFTMRCNRGIKKVLWLKNNHF